VGENISNERINDSDEIFITNWRPYIGKIERGFSMQAPSGIFEILEMKFKRKYPTLFIEYNWRYIDPSKMPDDYYTYNNRYPGIVIKDEQ
jgi:hypothetical protein